MKDKILKLSTKIAIGIALTIGMAILTIVLMTTGSSKELKASNQETPENMGIITEITEFIASTNEYKEYTGKVYQYSNKITDQEAVILLWTENETEEPHIYDIVYFNAGVGIWEINNTNAEYQKGYSAGYSEGYMAGELNGNNVGYTEGHTSGYNEGYSEGYNIGFIEGRNQGYEEGFNAGKATNIIGENLIKKADVKYHKNAYLIAQYELTKTVEIGETYTYQIKGTLGEGLERWLFYNQAGETFGANPYQYNYSESEGIYYQTFIATKTTTSLSIYAYPSQTIKTSIIEWVKLEKGSNRTEFTRAPIDEIEKAQEKGYSEGYYNGYNSGILKQTNELGFWELVPRTVDNVWNNTIMPVFQFEFMGVTLFDIWSGLTAIAVAIFIIKIFKI